MRDLDRLQKNFQAYLLQQCMQVQADIISTPKVPAIKRLDIYRDAYYSRLLDALKQDYTVLHLILGDEHFHQLGTDYIDAYPSLFRSIRWYGENLTKFMQSVEWFSDTPWLIELAHFEWLLTEAFDAHDSSVVALTDMAAIPFDQWPNMAFVIHPSLRRFKLNWNIVPLWTEMNENDTYIEPQQGDTAVDWIIWRRAYDLQFCSLTVDEAYMIEAMSSGKNFSEICEGLCEWIAEENVAIHAATLLKRFITDAIIVEINFTD